mgnify:CR=1 FL=1
MRIGHGLPRQDLIVTGDHGMVLDGLVINAAALDKGATIYFASASQLGAEFTVYHVETEGRDRNLYRHRQPAAAAGCDPQPFGDLPALLWHSQVGLGSHRIQFG